MKNLVRFTAGILLFGLAVCPAQAAFTSLYIFGDGISTTTNNPTPGQLYYGYNLRQSNGRVWVEVLAQRLGLGANSITNVNWSNSGNNWSYYGQYSPNLMTSVSHFVKPPDAQTALFVVWVNNADFVNDMATVYPSTNMVTWTTAINQSLANHWNVITNLYYAKGARTLIMPNAVDITEIPAYDNLILSAPATRNFIRQRIISFNTSFAALLNQARTSLPGITIYEPDFFSLLDNMLTNAAAYGLTNALSGGVSAAAITALNNPAMNGPGTNYIFWDATDPTANAQEVMADTVQQLIAPAQMINPTVLNGSNQLNVVNMPVGLNGFVDGTTNLAPPNWAPVQSFNSTTTTQSIFILTTNSAQSSSQNSLRVSPDDGPPGPPFVGGSTNPVVIMPQFYRLRFPYAWTWP